MGRKEKADDDLKIFIQARSTSTRYPGKVFKEIYGKAMWFRVVTAAIYAGIGDVVLLIPKGDSLKAAVKKDGIGNGFSVFEGPEHDVLRRFYEASGEHPSTYIMRLTSDCPLLTSEILREAWTHFKAHPAPYYCNRRWYPSGYDVEIFSRNLLQVCHATIEHDYYREHVVNTSDFHLDEKVYDYSVNYENDIEKADAVFRKMHGLE